MTQNILNYSPAGRRGLIGWLQRHRRRLVIVAIIVVPLCAAAFVLRAMAGPYLEQFRHLRMQDRISHQVLPAGTVIYTEDPARIALLSSKPDYRMIKASPGAPITWERAYSHTDFPALEAPLGPPANFQLDDNFGYLRTTATGHAWIVHLDQANPFEASAGGRKVTLTQCAVTPAGWKPGDRGVCVSFNSLFVRLQPADRFTLFAPQPDPANAARINVPYELNGTPGIFDATVTDTGYVEFTRRSGTATMVPWNAP